MRGIGETVRAIEARVLLSALVPVLSFVAFVGVAEEVTEGELEDVDRAILLAFRTPGDPSDPLGPPWFESFMRDISALGGLPVLLLVCLAIGGYLLLKKRRFAAGLLAASALGGLFLSFGLKTFFDRPRPDVVPHLTHVASASFPSGHASMSAVIYLTIAALLANHTPEPRLKIYCFTVALLLAGLVGLSRIYAGVHYPTDVVGGWALGLGWATLVWLVARRLERRGKA